MNEKDFAELAAGHALNALSPEDARAFEEARAQHPEWERDVMTDAATATMLADSVSAVSPPPFVRAALLAQIAVTSQHAAEVPATAPARDAVEPPSIVSAPTTRAGARQAKRRRFGVRSFFALAASLALLVGIGFGAAYISDQINTPASVVALQQIRDAPDVQSASATLTDGGEATAYWSDSVGKSVLVSDGLPTITDEQSFELWFVRDGAAVAAGTFSAQGGSATALLDGSIEAGDVIAVTVEDKGGSSTGQPTTDPILAIPTTA